MSKSYLQPDKRIMDYFVKAIGLPINVSPDTSINSWAQSRYNPRKDKCVIIKYDPAYHGILDYLFAHEAAHMLRLIRAPPHERKLPAVTPVTRREAFKLMSDDFHPLAKQIFDSDFIWDTLHFCYDVLLDQLVNTPMDIRIDRWLYDNFPDLRDTQAKAKQDEVAEYHEDLAPIFELVYPAVFNRSSNAIEFAFTRFLSELYADESLLEPYRGTEFEKIGSELYSMIQHKEDGGHAGDIEIIDQWAEKLGLRYWYRWRTLERS